MATTAVRSGQISQPPGWIADATVTRADLVTNSASLNTNVIAKVVQGTGIAMTSTGNDAGTGDVTINVAAPLTLTILDAETGGSSTAALNICHNSTGSPIVANEGVAIEWQAESTTNNARTLGRITMGWSDPADLTRTAYMSLGLVQNGTIATRAWLYPSGGFTNQSGDPGVGVINASSGYKVNNVVAPLGNVLTGDGAKHVSNGRGSGQTGSTTTAGTVSTTGVMAGLAGSIAITGTGRILVTVYGTCQSSIAGASCIIASIRYATPLPAPSHGAAPTGTTATGAGSGGQSINALANLPFSFSTVITGLTVGSTYWLDVVYASSSASSTAKMSAAVSAIEF